jgi:succinyl-CoA synthetase alpha subunit
MLEYGTRIVAGVSPGKGGEVVEGVPVYNFVGEAVEAHPEINTSIIFVPAPFAPDAIYEALDAGIRLVVIVTEGIPVHETMKAAHYARLKGTTLIGPNCPGVISPGKAKVGIMPAHLFTPGPVGIVSRSGTLSYEVAWALTRRGIGQSTAIGIGGDPVTGLSLVEAYQLFAQDPQTTAIVVIGEIGGDEEERLARHLAKEGATKPVVAYIAGRTAPPGKRMGHAGAIIMGGEGTAEEKRRALSRVGVPVADLPSQIPDLLQRETRLE